MPVPIVGQKGWKYSIREIDIRFGKNIYKVYAGVLYFTSEAPPKGSRKKVFLATKALHPPPSNLVAKQN